MRIMFLRRLSRLHWRRTLVAGQDPLSFIKTDRRAGGVRGQGVQRQRLFHRCQKRGINSPDTPRLRQMQLQVVFRMLPTWICKLDAQRPAAATLSADSRGTWRLWPFRQRAAGQGGELGALRASNGIRAARARRVDEEGQAIDAVCIPPDDRHRVVHIQRFGRGGQGVAAVERRQGGGALERSYRQAPFGQQFGQGGAVRVRRREARFFDVASVRLFRVKCKET